MSVLCLFVFLLLRFCDCGRSYALSSGNKTLHGPMLLESRLFCSHVLRSPCFFLNNKLRCASLEICKNTVRWNTLIYAQLLKLSTNFTIQLYIALFTYFEIYVLSVLLIQNVDVRVSVFLIVMFQPCYSNFLLFLPASIS